jgi:hypothetical protein
VGPGTVVKEVRDTRNFGKNLSSTFLCYDTDRIENDASKTFVACVLAAAVTFLPSLCLATIGGQMYRRTD